MNTTQRGTLMVFFFHLFIPSYPPLTLPYSSPPTHPFHGTDSLPSPPYVTHSGTNLSHYKAAHRKRQRPYHRAPRECHVSPTGINKTKTPGLRLHKPAYTS